jgi:hypothetical protein
LSKQSCDLYCLCILSFSQASHSSRQLRPTLIFRPAGQPFPALSSHVIFTRSWDGPQRVCTDSPNRVLASHHFHVYTAWKGAVVPCRKYIHSAFVLSSHVHEIKLESQCYNLFFQIYILGTFSSSVCCRNVLLLDHFLGAKTFAKFLNTKNGKKPCISFSRFP